MVLEVDPQRRRISLAIRSIMAALPASAVDLWENDVGGHFGARRSVRPRFPSRSWARPIYTYAREPLQKPVASDRDIICSQVDRRSPATGDGLSMTLRWNPRSRKEGHSLNWCSCSTPM